MPTDAPTAPPTPSTAPAQPVQSAPSPVTPTKTTLVTPPKTGPAQSALSSRPSRRGVTPNKPQDPTKLSEPLDTMDGAFSGIKGLAAPEEGELMGEESAKEVEPQKEA